VVTGYKIKHWFEHVKTDVSISNVRLTAVERTKVLLQSFVIVCISSYQVAI